MFNVVGTMRSLTGTIYTFQVHGHPSTFILVRVPGSGFWTLYGQLLIVTYRTKCQIHIDWILGPLTVGEYVTAFSSYMIATIVCCAWVMQAHYHTATSCLPGEDHNIASSVMRFMRPLHIITYLSLFPHWRADYAIQTKRNPNNSSCVQNF